MHDGAPAHYAQSVRDFLDRNFPKKGKERYNNRVQKIECRQ